MKIKLLLFLLLISVVLKAQISDASLITQATTIRNATAPSSNTAQRVGDMFLNIIASKENLANSTIHTVTSGTGTYTATIIPALAAYSTTQRYCVKFVSSNSIDNPTINFNGLGAKTILKYGNKAILKGEILAGQLCYLAYDGTNFQVITSPLPSKLTLDGLAVVNGFDASIYEATITGVNDYIEGQGFYIKFSDTNTVDDITLNINGLGYKSIVKNADQPIKAGDLVIYQVYLLVYDGTNFQLIGHPEQDMPNYGVANQIPVMNSTSNFNYSNNFWRDNTNNNFYSVSSFTNSNTGTQNHNSVIGQSHSFTGAGNIKWTNIRSEQGLIVSNGTSGTIHNATIDGGFNNKIEKQNTFSSFSCGIFNSNNSYIHASTASTTSSMIFCGRNDTIINASLANAFGYRMKITGDGSVGHGFFDTYSGGSHTGTIQSCEVAGRGAFGFFTHNSSAVQGKGIRGDYGIAIGCFNPYIPTTSLRNAIISGIGIEARSNEDDQVYVPNFNIDTTPTKNDTLSQVIVRYMGAGKRGQLQYRSANSIATNQPIRTVTTTTTLTLNDGTIIVDATSGAVTLDLPTAASAYDASNLTGHIYTAKLISATNSVTLDGNGSETIDGAATKVINTQYALVRIQSDGSNWHIIGQ